VRTLKTIENQQLMLSRVKMEVCAMLRNYQFELIKNVRASFGAGNRGVIMQMATGGGKTYCFSVIAKMAQDKGSKVLIITHRIELLKQAGGALENIGIRYCEITAKTKIAPINSIAIAMSETLHRRKDKLNEWLSDVDLCIIDECHLQNFDKLYSILPQKCIFLGSTATPIRQGGTKPLANYFSAIIEAINIKSLISYGFLSKPEYYGIPANLSGIKRTMGDFDIKQMDSHYSKAEVFEGVSLNYDKLIKGRKSIIFCPAINSAMAVKAELLKISEEPVFLVTGEMPETERTAIIAEFSACKTAHIINVGVLTAGFDCPSIDTVILYRATTSLALYLQMVGRGSRPFENKDSFRIIDFGDNVRRHGFWHDDRKWTLEVKKKREGVAPVKYCPKCNAILHSSATNCQHCGYDFPKKIKPKLQAELVKIDPETQRHQLVTYNDYLNYAKSKGYKKGWAWINFHKKYDK
jgi:superfamily II DNA or RNA helicase